MYPSTLVPPSTVYILLASESDVVDSAVPFLPLSFPSSAQSPESDPQLFWQQSGFPESIIRVMRPSSYMVIMASPLARHFMLLARIRLSLAVWFSPVSSRFFWLWAHFSCQYPQNCWYFHFDRCSRYRLRGRRQAGCKERRLIWTWRFALVHRHLYMWQRDYQRRVVYFQFKGNFSLVPNLHIEQSSRKFFFTRPIHWSSLLSSLIASGYTSNLIFKILL